MDRAFRLTDDGRAFTLTRTGERGLLEYQTREVELDGGLLWFETKRANGWSFVYVLASDVEPARPWPAWNPATVTLWPRGEVA